MKINTSKRVSLYPQSQRNAARMLFIVWLLVGCSPDATLAAPEREGAMVPATTTSASGQLASRLPGPIAEEVKHPCPKGDTSSERCRAAGNLKLASSASSTSFHQAPKYPGRSVRQCAQGDLATVDDRTPLLHQAVKDTGRSVRQHVQGNLATADDKTLTILHQAAKDQDPSLRQASAYALGSRATVDAKILTLLHQAAKDQDEDVRKIALEALKAFDSASLTPHTEKKYVLQKFFKQAVDNKDVTGLSKLILENTDEVGELLCESLACESLKVVDLLTAILPQTADTLLTWGVEHNKYELVRFIIERGRQHITNKLGDCLGQSVTKTAAQKGYRELFLLLINNAVDVDTRNITAFMSAIICGQYELAQAMIGFGEDRLEQPDKNGDTPQDYLDEKQGTLQIFGDEKLRKQKAALEALLHRKIQAMKQNMPAEERHALLKKEQ